MTVLPLAVAVSAPGAPGAVAPAVATRATGRAPEKHAASPDDCRQRANADAVAVDTAGIALSEPNPVGAGLLTATALREAIDGAPGAAGDDGPPHAADRTAIRMDTPRRFIIVASNPTAA